MKQTTTIQVYKKDARRLEKKKVYPNEGLKDVVNRLLEDDEL